MLEVQNSNFRNYFTIHKKAIITIVVLLALASIGTGITLTLRKALPGGITLISVGGIVLMALFFKTYHRPQRAGPLPFSSPPPPIKTLSKSISRSSPPEKVIELYATPPQKNEESPLPDHYVDPFKTLQTQEQFTSKLTSLLEELQKPNVHFQAIEEEFALLVLTLQLRNYLLTPEILEQISQQLHNDLPLGILFSLQKFLQRAPEQTPFTVNREVRYDTKQYMRTFAFSGLSREKELAIEASRIIEASEMGDQGMRMAIHQRPSPGRTKALIRAHINEFLSGKRNFIFRNENEQDMILRGLFGFLPKSYSSLIFSELYELQQSKIKEYSIENRRKVVEKLIDTCRDLPTVQDKTQAKKKLEKVYEQYYEQSKESRRILMFYLIDALKEGRRTYYERHPTYLNQERLDAVIKEYEEGNGKAVLGKSTQEDVTRFNTENPNLHAIVIREGEDRYLFEAAAQHLEGMAERIKSAHNEEEFEVVANEFGNHYRIIYQKLPTFSLSVAGTIHYSALSERSGIRMEFIEKGSVPQLLQELQKESHVNPTLIFQNFQELSDLLKDHEFNSLLIQLENALEQIECYTETDPNPLSRPKDEIDPLTQPLLIFKAIKKLQTYLTTKEHSFVQIHSLTSSFIFQEGMDVVEENILAIRKQSSLLAQLEQEVASHVLEAVRKEPSLKARALAMIEQQLRDKDFFHEGESAETALERYAASSLRGYQKLRGQLYNSKLANEWMDDDDSVEALMQAMLSPLNSGLIGILSQLLSFHDTPLEQGELGGHALKRGTFYGTLEVEPDTITEGTIAVLSTLPHDLSELKRAAAIIVEEGGPLSHAAHIARELDIPVVTGAKGSVARLQSLQNQPICLTTSAEGNTVESTSLPFPTVVKVALSPQERVIKKENVGGKGKHLIYLSKILPSLPTFEGLEVTFPNFVTIGFEQEIAAFYATSREGKTLQEAILEVMDSPEKIWKLIESTPFPFSLEKYREALQVGEKTSLIVRSSAALEDGAHSFAGMFESIPQVNTIESMELALKKVLFSAFASKVKSYIEERYISGYSPFEMGVILQHYVEDAEVSGVALSRDPLTSSKVIQMQLVRGVGGGVDGEGDPDSISIDRDKWEILRGLSGGEKMLITPREGRQLAKVIAHLEEQYGFPVDVEFALKRDEAGKLIVSIVQVRGITQ